MEGGGGGSGRGKENDLGKTIRKEWCEEEKLMAWERERKKWLGCSYFFIHISPLKKKNVTPLFPFSFFCSLNILFCGFLFFFCRLLLSAFLLVLRIPFLEFSWQTPCRQLSPAIYLTSTLYLHRSYFFSFFFPHYLPPYLRLVVGCDTLKFRSSKIVSGRSLHSALLTRCDTRHYKSLSRLSFTHSSSAFLLPTFPSHH